MARVAEADLRDLVEVLLESFGVPANFVAVAADALVSADMEGIASHGVMLLPMYADRIRAGSVNGAAVPQVVEDHGALVTLSAGHGLGQVSSQLAVDLVTERARVHGAAVIAVRDGFHFGAASYWTKRIAAKGMVGFAFSNTRPLMPAPGGAGRVVGNNPMSIAFPSASGEPLVIDMAMSATAMGKIRLADGRGEPIPEGWATDDQGNPTTSAAAAIAGMLLPAAGPKGFGLAVVIDLLCGALSGGAVGAAVTPLYGDPSVPYGCAHAFIAIDATKLQKSDVPSAVAAFADNIRHSAKAPGTGRVYAPGDLERDVRLRNGAICTVSNDLLQSLNDLAKQAGLPNRLSPVAS